MQIFLMGMVCLLLSTFSLTTYAMTSFETPDSRLSIGLFNGGISVVLQGLTEEPIEFAYPNMREGMEVTVTVYSSQGEVLFQVTSTDPHFDLSSLELPEGEKTVVVEVGGETQTLVFQ